MTFAPPTEPKANPDRRRGFRIRKDRPIKIHEPRSARYFPGHTQDMSATGLRIQLPVSTPVRAGSLLNIHVGGSAPGQSLASHREMIPARVVWIDRDHNTAGRLTAGVEFLAASSGATDMHLDAAA